MRNNNIIYILVLILIFSPVPSRIESEDNNLLMNGDFEEPGLTGWEKEFWNEDGEMVSTDRKVYNGKYSLMIFSGTVENDVRLTQEVPVEPDSYYKLSGFIASENIQEGKIGANICLMAEFDYAGNVTGTEDWRYYELFFKTHQSHYMLKVGARLGMYYNTVKGTAYFDDLRLEKLDFVPQSYINLGESKENGRKDEKSEKDHKRNEQKQNIKKADPVFSKIDLPLILLLLLIGLIPVFINAFFTIRREKKNEHT